MSTITTPRKSVKSSPSKGPRPFSCSIVSLTIEVNDCRYSVDQTDPGEFGTKAFRLTKHGRDDGTYDVIHTNDGFVECSCPDYEARHRGNGYGTCKHGKALVSLGLLAAPRAPMVNHSSRMVDKTPAPVVNPNSVRDDHNQPEPAAEPVAEPVAEPTAPAPCCPASEPAPCTACVAEIPTHAVEVPADAVLTPSNLVDPFADDTDPATWPSWTDSGHWELGDDAPDALEGLRRPFPADDAPNVPTMPFDAWISLQASAIRSYGTDAAAWLASKLDALADQAGALGATTPDEFDARDEIMGPSHVA